MSSTYYISIFKIIYPLIIPDIISYVIYKYLPNTYIPDKEFKYIHSQKYLVSMNIKFCLKFYLVFFDDEFNDYNI